VACAGVHCIAVNLAFAEMAMLAREKKRAKKAVDGGSILWFVSAPGVLA
jgi:hypothetical protein